MVRALRYQPRRTPEEDTQRTALSVSPGIQQSATASAQPVNRPRDEEAEDGDQGDWVVVELEADIVAKNHPYISFDPTGSY